MTWVTVEEFAEWTGEAASTIRRKCQRGDLPSRKFGVRWKIDKDLFERQAEEEMLLRMERNRFVASIPKSTGDNDWLKRQRAKLLAKARSV